MFVSKEWKRSLKFIGTHQHIHQKKKKKKKYDLTPEVEQQIRTKSQGLHPFFPYICPSSTNNYLQQSQMFILSFRAQLHQRFLDMRMSKKRFFFFFFWQKQRKGSFLFYNLIDAITHGWGSNEANARRNENSWGVKYLSDGRSWCCKSLVSLTFLLDPFLTLWSVTIAETCIINLPKRGLYLRKVQYWGGSHSSCCSWSSHSRGWDENFFFFHVVALPWRLLTFQIVRFGRRILGFVWYGCLLHWRVWQDGRCWSNSNSWGCLLHIVICW